MTYMNLQEAIENGLERVISWRRDKASQYPDDDRNQQAISIAQGLLGGRADRALSERYDAIGKAIGEHDPDMLTEGGEAEAEVFRRIGFGSVPVSFNALAAEVCDAWEAMLTDAGNQATQRARGPLA